MKTFWITALLATLTACGPLNEGGGSQQVFQQIVGQLTGNKTPDAPPAISPEIANAGPGNVLLVTLRARGAVAPMTRAGQNGNRTTWISPGKISMTFEDDILISTRGLGDDLMGSDIPGLRRAINAGGGTTTRTVSYLNSEDQIVTQTLTCAISRAGAETVTLATGPQTLNRVNESCRGERLAFENAYWLDGTTIVKSLQVISATQGFIEAERL